MFSSKTLTRISLTLIATVFIATIIMITQMVLAWYSSRDVDTTSDNFYAIKEGYEEHFISYDSLYGKTITDYDSTGEIITTVSFIPGDVVYFSFIFDLKENELLRGETLKINLEIEGDKSSNATIDNGDFDSFLTNTIIESNECRLALVNENNGLYSYISEISITNTACNDLSEPNFNITIPSFTTYGNNYYLDDENIKHIRLMAFVPIWYQDNNSNQNNEMESIITIKKTIITN